MIFGLSAFACRSKGAPNPTESQGASGSAVASGSASANSVGAKAFYADRFSKRPMPARMTDLGRLLFFDPNLSASRQMSCGTCHDPRFAYGPANDRPTQLGGPELRSEGLRAVPSLRYLNKVPRFTEHYVEEALDDSTDQGPTGGQTWDGRADTLHDQARAPLTSPFEMANDSIDAVVAKVKSASYADQFQETFGQDVFADPVRASTAVLLTLEVFQQSPKDFYPFSSRYDAYLRQKGELSAAELRGLSLFKDPKKGRCSTCHPSEFRRGSFPIFTDFGYNALGVPRNRALAANRDPAFYDLGLCGPLRTDLGSHHEYCGEFRAPTLRNVAVRRSFFHNGVFHRLSDVLAFYAERDTSPAKWYAKASGQSQPYDDIPPPDRKNVNQEPPFGRKPGQAPPLTRAEIADLIAFLGTLTDADLAPNAKQP